MSDARLVTERFTLRPLTPEDATERYSRWLDDASLGKAIYAAAKPHAVEDLRRFISERSGREDVVFWGIFEKGSGVHIGNIKYEPVDPRAGYAIMGILIGEPAWRGKGVGPEVLAATAAWLKRERGVSRILLGVRRDNEAAIRSYEKTGFRAEAVPEISLKDPKAEMTMAWRLA